MFRLFNIDFSVLFITGFFFLLFAVFIA